MIVRKKSNAQRQGVGGSVIIAVILTGCGSSPSSDQPLETPPPPLTGWAAVRASAQPHVAVSDFDVPVVQAIAGDAWEDGICISRDGLSLYATYVPADLLSFVMAGGDQTHAADYLRGPTLGMDLHTNPVGMTTWIHGNIVYAQRASTTIPFAPWQLTAMARPTWSEGGAQPYGTSTATWNLFAYTTNEHAPDYKAHICIARNAAHNPTTLASLLPAPVTTSTSEDNPHVERVDASHLVLFFDSDDRPGASGAHDLWWTTSADDGATWAVPAPVTSLNSSTEEEQPHLFQDGGTWRLYFTATNPADGKLGIYRATQTTPGDWNSWGTRQLVIGAGNTAGVGEPTLTSYGDLSFVTVIQDPRGPATNRFDADPWLAARRPTAIGLVPKTLPALSASRGNSAHQLSLVEVKIQMPIE